MFLKINNIKLPILTFVLLLLAYSAFTQETGLRRSTVVEQYKGNPYYLHFVKSGETVPAILEAYNISLEELKLNNPSLQNDLKVDQVLRIPQKPVKPAPIISEQQQLNPIVQNQTPTGRIYVVKRKETLYGISKQFNVTVDDILKANPQITTLQEGMEIIIPQKDDVKIQPTDSKENNTPKNVAGNKKVMEVTVETGQTAYSISRKYGISVEEFFALNPDATSGLKSGQAVKVPASDTKPSENAIIPDNQVVVKEEPVSTPSNINKPSSGFLRVFPNDSCKDARNRSKTFEIALLLPLALEETDSIISLTEESPKNISDFKAFDFFQFYSGIKLAADSLEKSGFKANIHVYDADMEGDTLKIKKALVKSEMAHMDLIIGPVFVKSFDVAARFALKKHVNIVNPLSKRDRITEGNPFVFKAQLSDVALGAGLANHIAEHYPKANLILIRPDLKDNVSLYSAFLNTLKQDPAYNSMKVKEINYAVETFTAVSKSINPDKQNVILLFSSSRALVPNFVSMLNNLAKDKDITLFGLPDWRELSIETEFLVKLNYHEASTSYINYESEAVKQFVRNFRSETGAEPQQEKHAFLGYDLGWYFFSALMNYGSDFPACLPSSQYQGFLNDYRFASPSGSGGYSNSCFRIITLRDYKWVEVK
ncbi:MAG: LysM peptidoglycan-binding domain-containing protein [Bacteroidales bacterium]|nr:LysM peptidoglycan-binding domain-containing protein [Bacteroidales bacterium]